MTFPRQFPIGVPFRAQLTSTIGTNWDTFISQSCDGVGGGTYSGALIFTNAVLGGSSTVNTTGNVTANNIAATGTLSATGACSFNGAVSCLSTLTVSSTFHAIGQATFDQDARAALGCLEGKVVIADKMQPRNVYETSVDCAGGGVTVNLNLTLYDNFIIHLFDSGGVTNTAVLHAFTFTTVTANTDLQIKKGAKFRIVIDSPGQTGGMGLDFVPFPVTVDGYSRSDALGPRSGDATGTGGDRDFMIWELENVGPVGSPSFYAKLIAMNGAP